jgi:hypothetical protein
MEKNRRGRDSQHLGDRFYELERDHFEVEWTSRSGSLVEHDLSGKPLSHPSGQARGRAFPDHALVD